MRWVVNIWECLSRMFYDYHKTPGVLVSLFVCFWFGLWVFFSSKSLWFGDRELSDAAKYFNSLSINLYTFTEPQS